MCLLNIGCCVKQPIVVKVAYFSHGEDIKLPKSSFFGVDFFIIALSKKQKRDIRMSLKLLFLTSEPELLLRQDLRR